MVFEDKRKFPRSEFREPVAYRLSESGVFNGSVGYDLSQGGVRFRSEDFIPQDAEVVINLELKPERKATLTGRVVWAQKVAHSEMYHIGCEFLENRANVFPLFIVKSFLESL